MTPDPGVLSVYSWVTVQRLYEEATSRAGVVEIPTPARAGDSTTRPRRPTIGAMPTTIAGPPPGTKPKAKPRPRVNAAAIEAEVAAIRAELLKYAWGVVEHSYRDKSGRVCWLLEARWGTDSQLRVESTDRLAAWAEVLRKAGQLGLLGPESRPRGWRPRRAARGPRVVSFTDLGYDPS
jgi:hypothetical protein